MKRNRYFSTYIAFICFATFAFAATSALCTSPNSNTPPKDAKAAKEYYDGVRRGWYWYEKEPPKEEKKKEEEPKVEKKVPTLEGLTNQQLWDMHPDDFQKLYDEIKKKAVQNPSPQNIGEWIRLTDIARRKALAFTTNVSVFLQKNPDYDAKTLFPDAEPGRRAQYFMRKEEIDNLLMTAKRDYGIIYFYSPQCKYCDAQKEILDWFIKRYDWEYQGYDVRIHQRVAQYFKVNVTPSIFIIARKSGDTMPISAGVISADDLTHRLYRSIRVLSGTVPQSEYYTWDSDIVPFMRPAPPPDPKFNY